jgi:hypothetical protein
MKTLAKTKIIRLPGREVYFQKVQFENGDIRWRVMEKDLSAIIPAMHDSRFKGTNSIQFEPKFYDKPLAPVPENFSADLLSPFGALEYAAGHKPESRWRF